MPKIAQSAWQHLIGKNIPASKHVDDHLQGKLISVSKNPYKSHKCIFY